MRTTSQRIFATATAAAALLVLLFLATGPTPSWPDSSEFMATSDFPTVSFGTPDQHATFTGTSMVCVGPTATSTLVTNACYNCMTSDFVEDCAVGCCGEYTIVPDFQTADVNKNTSTPDGRTRTTTTTTSTSRRHGIKTTATTATSATRSDPSLTRTSRTIIFHDKFDGAFHKDTSNESRWRQFQHEPLRLPDQFIARFLNTLMYLAEVITADVVSAFLFGRWRPRYYQRAKKNRLDRARRRRYRRFMMFAADVATTIWDACVRLHDTLYPMQNGVSGPTFQMVSNVQLTEYPATISTFADVSTSDVAEIMGSARCSAIVSTASLSALPSACGDLPLLRSSGAQVQATTTGVRPAVSTYAPRLLVAPEMSESASCQPRTSLPITEIDIALQSTVPRHSPFLLEAAPHTTGPLLLTIDATNGCAVGMVNSLVLYTTAERSVTTPVEEIGGPADDADDTPPAPFFVSEHYTPESICYVSAHGVAYTTITMSYAYHVNLPTSRGSQDETPTTTQTGDVSDILFPASNAKMRCKWSRECIQTASSEYYRSSVEAVFVARFIPDETDMVVLSDLVTRHL